MKMAWKLANIKKDPNSKELYADLFISQIKEEPKTACLFTVGDARTVEIILEKYKNTQFVVFDYPALIKFLDFAKPANLFKTIPLKYDWESEAEFLKFVETEIQKASQELGEKRMFDLIIANPPYGDDNKGTLPRKIVKAVKKCAKESVWLMPMTHFQYDNLFKEIASFKRFSKIESQNIFEGASCPPLSIVRFDGKEHNLFKDKFDYSLPRTPLVNAFRQYNKIHPSCCDLRSAILRHSNLGVNDGKSPSAFDPDTFKLYDQSFYERTLVFGMYWISNGMHTDEGNAIDNFWNYKLDNYEDFQAKVKELGAHPDLHAATFNSKIEKQNCEKYRHGRLYSKLLSEFDNGGSIDYIKLCIPNLDWSHPWTDAEILKEIGLPEDFLGE